MKLKSQNDRSAKNAPPKPSMAAKRVVKRKSYQVPSPIDLVMKLMAIPGKSGDETAVAKFVKEQLLSAGASESAITHDKAHLQTPLNGAIGNLICQFPGTARTPRRLFMAHLDTVPTCLGAEPMIEGGVIRSANPNTGVGADDRAGVAVVLHTALRILCERPKYHPATFLFPIQEEVGLFGARYADHALLGKPKLAFNWDGGIANSVITGATGGYRMQITVHGQASHAGVSPEQGVSAIAIASIAIAELHREGWHGKIVRGKQWGTSNVGVIQGGDATNVVTDKVVIRAEARSHHPAFRKKIIRQIESAFKNAVKEVKNDKGKIGKVVVDGRLDYEAFALANDEPCVQAAIAGIRTVGLEPITKISNGGLDANWMSARGIPTVTLGCGQRNPHMVTEELNLEDFQNACAIAWELATQGCT
jgi:tripeptide aminopeptidase